LRESSGEEAAALVRGSTRKRGRGKSFCGLGDRKRKKKTAFPIVWKVGGKEAGCCVLTAKGKRKNIWCEEKGLSRFGRASSRAEKKKERKRDSQKGENPSA